MTKYILFLFLTSCATTNLNTPTPEMIKTKIIYGGQPALRPPNLQDTKTYLKVKDRVLEIHID